MGAFFLFFLVLFVSGARARDARKIRRGKLLYIVKIREQEEDEKPLWTFVHIYVCVYDEKRLFGKFEREEKKKVNK